MTAKTIMYLSWNATVGTASYHHGTRTYLYVWRTYGRYRKQMKMKRGYPKPLYNQHNKDETIFSVMKRLFGK